MISPWLEEILRGGYHIQFEAPPPPFQGVVEASLTHPEERVALETEIRTLLEKRGDKEGTLGAEESGLVQPIFSRAQ